MSSLNVDLGGTVVKWLNDSDALAPSAESHTDMLLADSGSSSPM